VGHPQLPPIWTVTLPSHWATAPERMSVSALLQMESCPKRWSLSHADYSDLWGYDGYPPKPNLAALKGTIVHRALAKVVTALVSAGCCSILDVDAIAAIATAGGYTQIIDAATRQLLDETRRNPRSARAMHILRRKLTSHTPSIRHCVQTLLARLDLASVRAPRSRAPAGTTLERRPLGFGTHSEVHLYAPSLRWVGAADILSLSQGGCEMIDFKTGAPRPHHPFQIRVYALLWSRDPVLNPAARVADSLTLSYPTEETMVPPPTARGLELLAQELRERSIAARAAVAGECPQATPAPEECALCDVRQLCDEYWDTAPPLTRAPDYPHSVWMDVQVRLTRQTGLLQWEAVWEKPSTTPREAAVSVGWSRADAAAASNWRSGWRIRLLDVLLTPPEDGGSEPRVASGGMSEAFLVPD